MCVKENEMDKKKRPYDIRTPQRRRTVFDVLRTYEPSALVLQAHLIGCLVQLHLVRFRASVPKADDFCLFFSQRHQPSLKEENFKREGKIFHHTLS